MEGRCGCAAGRRRRAPPVVRDWIDEQAELGRGQPVSGSVGRGASGFAAVLEFVGQHAAAGVISVAAGLAFKQLVQRAREALRGRDRPRLHVSRGGAAYLALAEVADQFGEQEPLELEAVEEPSSIAGNDVSELSYVGLEPWIVLLRNRDTKVRYVVVVGADGEVLGALRAPMSEWEALFLPDVSEAERAKPARRRRRSFWRRPWR